MTEEELAEKYIKENNLEWELECHRTDPLIEEICQAFLAGLKAGRPQWHDLRKDPDDLPKNRRNVWITYINGYNQRETTEASFRYKYWVISGHKTGCEVIAWCEIPKFKE